MTMMVESEPLETIPEIDESTRPLAPPIPGVTETQRVHGRRLAAFHRHHLGEFLRVQAMITAVAAGDAPAAEIAPAVRSLRMAQNLAAVGTLCGRACLMLTMHHDIEEARLFPTLRGGSPGLRRVVDRLAEEHRTVHALLVRLEAEATALASGDAAVFADLARYDGPPRTHHQIAFRLRGGAAGRSAGGDGCRDVSGRRAVLQTRRHRSQARLIMSGLLDVDR